MSGSYTTPAGPLRAIAEALVQGGVRDVVICPGSRSTPLALALRAAPGLRCWVHLDERAGAFFALGAARAARRPCAILATSGTAVVNFAPAVTEARYGRVPLILLTADRPPELQGIGAPQTIDQVELYGRHAKRYLELPPPLPTPASEAQARRVTADAVAAAVAAPAGPVQLNLPFREPLLPKGSLTGGPLEAAAPVAPPPRVTAEDLEVATCAIADAERGLIVCGPLDVPGFGAAIATLARATGYPVLADGLANVRSGAHDRSHVIAHHDLLLRSDTVRRWARPDLVLRFGATPTSKALGQLLDETAARQLLVDDGHGWQRPTRPRLIEAEPAGFAEELAGAVAPGGRRADGWLARWQAAEAAAVAALRSWREQRVEPFEGAVFEMLDGVVPDGTIVVAGNSMPVRDLDSFLPASGARIRCLGNRGANGIDGLVSTALGAAAVAAEPVVAVLGDLSLLHDATALVAARRLGIDATIVLIDNDGGGIFSFLPQASASAPAAGLPRHYEELFGTPHGTDFAALTSALGAEHVAVDGATLPAALAEAVSRDGVQVLQLRSDRARNVALHRDAAAAVARAVEGLA